MGFEGHNSRTLSWLSKQNLGALASIAVTVFREYESPTKICPVACSLPFLLPYFLVKTSTSYQL